MWRQGLVLAALAIAASMPPQLPAPTLAAHDRYVAATEQRIAAEQAGQAPFLWLDRLAERERGRMLERLRRGETVVERLQTRDGGREIHAPDGLIHHWVATVLLPGVSVDQATALLRDYPRYPQLFTPLIVRTSPARQAQGRDVVPMRTYVSKVVTVVMDGDYVIEHTRLSPTRAVSKTVATNLHVVHDAGLKTERREPADQTSGNLWRYRMYCVLDTRPEGVYDQCESITLTRSVPALVSWVVGPFVNGIPRDSLSLMLTATRRSLIAKGEE
jgi:hypothetical protein